MVVYIKSLKKLDEVAQLLIETHKSSRVFAFYGEMGAGKTTFIKAICKRLQVNQIVNSPTFSLVNEYHAADGQRIYHFDFYRIKKISEVFDIGYEEYFYSGNFCFIEWPDRIKSLLPEKHVSVTIEFDGENRKIIFQ